MFAWHDMRARLWPDVTQADNERAMDDVLNRPDRNAVFVSDSGTGLQGMVEVRLRDYADGCDSSPVGFLEGLYVVPEYRRRGIGRLLVARAEEWARSLGCTEMASDALLDNVGSQRAHGALGYVEVERQVCFRKSLVFVVRNKETK
jgi:aminoglycoside 6'-N-acetyltransferase I